MCKWVYFANAAQTDQLPADPTVSNTSKLLVPLSSSPATYPVAAVAFSEALADGAPEKANKTATIVTSILGFFKAAFFLFQVSSSAKKFRYVRIVPLCVRMPSASNRFVCFEKNS